MAPAPTLRRLCITIDDFGLHEGINRSALQLVRAGRAQAVGCMVGAPAWLAGARALRALDPEQADIGLHLDLTEWPLSPMGPQPLRRLIGACLLRGADTRALRQQIRLQLDRFEDAMDRSPAYVDGHQHVHQLPRVRAELLDELAARSQGGRPWLRSTLSAALPGPLPQPGWRARFKPWVIQQLGGHALTRMAERGGYRRNARLLGVYDFQGGEARYAQWLALWLRASRDGDLLMCHPAMAIADGCGHGVHADPIAAARLAEFSVLSGDTFGRQLQKAVVQLQPLSLTLGLRPPRVGTATPHPAPPGAGDWETAGSGGSATAG